MKVKILQFLILYMFIMMLRKSSNTLEPIEG